MTLLDLRDDEELSPGDLAAIEARSQWIEFARHPDRRGRQLPPVDADWHLWMARAGRGWGKLLDIETPIPTPSGWTTMGELKPGDQVFDEAGKPCNVIWASGHQSPLVAYRVRFSDETYIDACAEHQWVTWTHAERKAFYRRSAGTTTKTFPDNWPQWHLPVGRDGRVGPAIRTTQQIADTLRYSSRCDRNHCIPQTAPLDLPDVDLPIPPYTFGLWLGDGSSYGSEIYAHVDDQKHYIEQINMDGFSVKKFSNDPLMMRVGGLWSILRKGGFLKNKHVPTMYLRASAAQRLALLQGMMDSDGGVDWANAVSFTNTNRELVEAVYELVVSLGMKATKDDRIPMCTNTGVAGARAYRVAFTPTMPVFRLERKRRVLVFDGKQALRRHHRMIVAVEPITPIAMQCITVDSPNSMYLAGRQMVPTHNTLTLAQWQWWECWRVPNIIGHWVAPTTGDAVGTGFEGHSGFRSIIPAECLWGGSWDKAFRASNPILLRLANGSVIRGFGAVKGGGRLRGPQCHNMCGDELREWDSPAGNLQRTLDNALFGLRLPYPDGTPARGMLATTPKPIPYMKQLEKRPGVVVVTGSTRENARNLSSSLQITLGALNGTLMGRQEIDGVYMDEENDQTIIKRSWIKVWPVGTPLPEFMYIIESYDTASSDENYDWRSGETDPSACSVWGLFNTHQFLSEKQRKAMGVAGRYGALLLDCWQERLGLPDLLERARRQHNNRWGPKPGRRSDLVLVEDKNVGPALRQFLSKWGVPVWPMVPRRDKAQRLHATAPIAKQGMIFVPESQRPDRKGEPRDWVEPLLDQICTYVGAGSVEHDDLMDTFSQVINYMREKGMLVAEPEKLYSDMEDKRAAQRKQATDEHEQQRRQYVGNPYAA